MSDISLEEAQDVVEAALAKSRQDGAWLGSVGIAQRKARTARYFGMSIRPSGQVGSDVAVRAADRQEMDDRLTEALEGLIPEALRAGDRGILITRTSASTAVVQLHPDVPFGETRERQDW